MESKRNGVLNLIITGIPSIQTKVEGMTKETAKF